MARLSDLRERIARPRLSKVGYELFVLALSVWVLVILLVEVLLPLPEDVSTIIQGVDQVVCVFFLIDFAYRLASAEARLKYFLTWGWLDLLSSIPMVDALRSFRAARIVRIVRLLRAARSGRQIIEWIMKRRAQSTLLAAVFLAIVMLVVGSIGILYFEQDAPGANIVNGADALWWSMVTITTVGYGDFSPVTAGGRVLAGILMTIGIGLFGTFSGYLATRFLESGMEREFDETEANLEAQIDALRASLDALTRALEARGLGDLIASAQQAEQGATVGEDGPRDRGHDEEEPNDEPDGEGSRAT